MKLEGFRNINARFAVFSKWAGSSHGIQLAAVRFKVWSLMSSLGMSDIGFFADIRYAILSNSKFSIPISADTDVDIWVIYFSSNLI